MPAVQSTSLDSAQSLDQYQTMSFNALVSRLIEIVAESTWSHRRISHTLVKLQRGTFQESIKKQAQTYRSILPTLLNVTSCGLNAVQAASLFKTPNSLLSQLFFGCRTKTAATQKFVKQILDPLSSGCSIGANFLENYGKAKQTEESSRGEIAKTEEGHMGQIKNEAESAFSEMLRTAISINEARRSTISTLFYNQRA